jgi:hypothetical protein
MEKQFEQFENDVMSRIIAENPRLSNVLAKQYKYATVLNRNFTGVGFFADFEVADKSLSIQGLPNLQLGNVQAKLKGLELGAGFVLFVRDGLIQTLECYTYGEPWPNTVCGYTLE